MSAPALILREGKEKSLRRGHPWLFAGAIASLRGTAASGETVEILASNGEFLARAAYSPASQIRARVWSFAPDEDVDGTFFARRIKVALARRAGLAVDSTALRLVHGEADGLPGLIVDRYADWLVVQLLSAGVERHRDVLITELLEQSGCVGAYERSDAEVRALEGLEQRVGLLSGGPIPERIEIEEHGLRYAIDVVSGQKTGFFIDQRDNRSLLRARAQGEVLNCFCYTGGFTLSALAGGAESVLSIDSSPESIVAGRANLARNALPADRAEWLCADAFTALRDLRNQGRQFDAVVLDPPKFAPTAAHVEKAARAYKDINLLAIKLLRPEGLLCTFSCSGGVSAELFQKIVAGAAADAGASLLIEARLYAGADHPVALAFPEGDYLKGLLLRKTAAIVPATFRRR